MHLQRMDLQVFWLCGLTLVLIQRGLCTTNSPKKVVCYYGSWAEFRTGNGRFTIDQIDPFLCTHLIYSFVGINGADGSIRILDTWKDLPSGLDGFNKFNALKKKNPALKTLVAIGGFNEGSISFSNVMRNPVTRSKFVDNAVQFVTQWGFDGFDLDWEYPAQHGGAPEDKVNFILLIKELRAKFDPLGYLLSAAVSCAPFSVDISYNIPEMGKYLDFINIMAYDLHGSWDHVTGQNAPLYGSASETSDFARQLNVDASIKHWLKMGAPAEKLILGIGTYGQTYTLSFSNRAELAAPTAGAGYSGPYTRQAGMLGYNEICEMQLDGQWVTRWDDVQKVPYTSRGNQWIGYDDTQSVQIKTEYALALNLGGAMIWSLETDDFLGLCQGGKKYPLLRVINEVLTNGTPDPVVPSIPVPATTTTAAATTTTVGTTTTTVGVSTTTVGTTTTTQAPTTTSSSGEGNTSSVCFREGYVRDPANCQKFFYCQLVHGKFIANAFNCASNLFFDRSANVCNYRDLVVC